MWERELRRLDEQVRAESRRVADRLLALPPDRRWDEYKQTVSAWQRTGAALHPEDEVRIRDSFKVESRKAEKPASKIQTESLRPPSLPKATAIEPPRWLEIIMMIGFGLIALIVIVAIAAAGYHLMLHLAAWVWGHRGILALVVVLISIIAAGVWTIRSAIQGDGRQLDPMVGVAGFTVGVAFYWPFHLPGWLSLTWIVLGASVLIRVYLPFYALAAAITVAAMLLRSG